MDWYPLQPSDVVSQTKNLLAIEVYAAADSNTELFRLRIENDTDDELFEVYSEQMGGGGNILLVTSEYHEPTDPPYLMNLGDKYRVVMVITQINITVTVTDITGGANTEATISAVPPTGFLLSRTQRTEKAYF